MIFSFFPSQFEKAFAIVADKYEQSMNKCAFFHIFYVKTQSFLEHFLSTLLLQYEKQGKKV